MIENSLLRNVNFNVVMFSLKLKPQWRWWHDDLADFHSVTKFRSLKCWGRTLIWRHLNGESRHQCLVLHIKVANTLNLVHSPPPSIYQNWSYSRLFKKSLLAIVRYCSIQQNTSQLRFNKSLKPINSVYKFWVQS